MSDEKSATAAAAAAALPAGGDSAVEVGRASQIQTKSLIIKAALAHIEVKIFSKEGQPPARTGKCRYTHSQNVRGK